MIIKNKILGIDSNDVLKCSDKTQLVAWMDAIDLQLAGLKTVRDRLKRGVAQTGDYQESFETYSKREAVIKYQGLLIRQIQRRLGDIRDNKSKTRSHTYERHFMLACKRRLSDDLFLSLCDEAHEMANQEENQDANRENLEQISW